MAGFLLWAAAGGVIATLVALRLNRASSGAKISAGGEAAVYVIGDLHGDAECAAYWIDRLELVDPQKKEWLKPEASLVFMGDYVDKGPYSLQTMQLVRSLTEAFPDKVTALMGNHELELLRDRDDSREPKYMQLVWSAVHPGEYQHYLTERDWDETDEVVLDLLLNASIEVYANRWHQSVLLAPRKSVNDQRHAIVEIFQDDSVRSLVSERLEEYQTAYLKAFASNTTLGQWVESLKVAHVEQGIFFCHGGLHPNIVSEIQNVGGVDALNDMVREHATTDKFVNFLETPTGQAVYNMLVYRGNHKESSQCGGLPPMLEELGLARLAVGHTPSENVRSMCDEQFWALDSLLGRWIRTSGNMYCPMQERKSQSGAFVCDPIPNHCEGQVVKMTKDSVEIIH
jgi:hypothetical protein